MRKKYLPAVLLTALSASIFSAQAATPPNTLVVAQGLDDLVSLDPAEANELSSIQTIPSLYQRLVQADRDNPEKVIPVLAESWTTDAASKTLTITLRNGAVFASGNPVRPEDVIWSYTRAINLNKSPHLYLMFWAGHRRISPNNSRRLTTTDYRFTGLPMSARRLP